MRRREILLALLLGALALALLWWTHYRAAPLQEAEEAFPSEIDYFMTDVQLTATDEAGRPSYHLRSPRIEHVIADDSTLAERPYMEVFSDPAPPWRLRAEAGRMPAGGVTIDLIGEVALDREAGEALPRTRARTREVTVNTVEKTARTAQPVTVSHGNWDIDGVGMRLDLVTGRLEMTRVRGIYEPPG